MIRNTYTTYILLLICLATFLSSSAQEYAGPVYWNPHQARTALQNTASKKTVSVLTLPFFEDFTGYSASPDSSKWVDGQVYINNTMGIGAVSRGVATFDDLNAHGIPYDSFSNVAFRYADSLTSHPIDLSTNNPGDSIYLSFFYQPQGNGFFPLLKDSLMLFMKNRYGDFVKVWAAEGSALLPFQQVMIPIVDTLYFHDAFQFRFTNIAALFWADAVWNLDYIRMDRNRNMNDTAVREVAFVTNPSFLLNDYTYMPYSQFIAAHASELSSQVRDSIRNRDTGAQAVSYSVTVHDIGTGVTLSSAGPGSINIPAYQERQVALPVSIAAFPPYPTYKSVVFETMYTLQTTTPMGSTVNDTVIKNQTFENYLAYDDGTAEKSYYLNLGPSLPGKIAIEYHLNHPDTLWGLAIYFGRQIPFANYKPFFIYVYSSLAGVNGSPADVKIDSTDLVYPAYADSVNHFWYYTFDHPRLLPAGTFFAGTVQPFGGGSDSVYFGLDVNRIGNNHVYYNVNGPWVHSTISGAVMIRPLIGRYVSGSAVDDVTAGKDIWQVYPNPARNELQFSFAEDAKANYRLTDLRGQTLMQGAIFSGSTIDISQLPPGMYFVNLLSNGIPATPKKIIKL